MTAISAGASSACTTHWSTIDWSQVEQHVKRLQMRIAKAIKDRKPGKAKALQWLLSRSHFAKLLAVKRVTQSKGSKTPGVDGVLWNSSKKKLNAAISLKRRGYKAAPLRRVCIPKKNGKKRPLGIPCMIDRAHQALHLLGLEPISETLADGNAYGFRPRRSVADAIEHCFIATSRRHSPQWILEGDIKACFDKIGHQWLIDNIPMDKTMLNQWLKSGYIDKGMFYRTDSGTPQGGIISPTLCVMTLRGLERAVKDVAVHRKDKINFISYADDFVVTGASQEVLEHKVKPVIQQFLNERGLELSKEKTFITHISQGFDFLGFNVRKYKSGKLLTKPTKANVFEFIKNIKRLMRKYATMEAGELVRLLNPKIMGWANFYRHSVAKQTFNYVDNRLFKLLYRWALRRHPNKSKSWVAKKYFGPSPDNGNTWNFFGYVKVKDKKTKVFLSHMMSIPIKRHIKIRADANPYDPAYGAYFERRRKRKTARNHWHDSPETAM